jgi:predicted Zn-dependent protease
VTHRTTFTVLTCIVPLIFAPLSGCTTNPATGENVFTGGMDSAQEISIGREQHPQIIKAFGGEYGSPELRRYIDSIGQLLARTVERREFKYKFTLLNSGIVNAFALPGGYIYISRGLLTLAENEAEVAGVLAHELGHINALHHGRRQGSETIAGILIAGAGIAANAAGVGGNQIGQLGSAVAQSVLRGYSREHELESDRLALRYMTRAGYDPRAMVDFLKKMRGQSRLEAKRLGQSPDKVDATNYLATHPAPIERVRKASALAGQYRVANPMLARDIYLKKIDGIIYGDDPDQGFIRGRSFVHPKLRFRFEVPDRFQLFNSPTQVRAVGPDGATIIFDSARKPSDGPVSYYVTNVWGRGTRLSGLETIHIDGLESATATARVSTNDGPRDARLLAIRKDLQTIFRFAFLTKPGQAARWSTPFRRTSHSFRLLTESEASAIKPLRVRTVRVRRGDTVSSLARRMAGEDGFSLDRFLLINGLTKNAHLRPGQIVKIIDE